MVQSLFLLDITSMFLDAFSKKKRKGEPLKRRSDPLGQSFLVLFSKPKVNDRKEQETHCLQKELFF